MSKNTPIVITTIFPPSKAIKKYVNKGCKLYIVADKKTPTAWKSKNCLFISLEEQKKLFPILTHLLSYNHYARKNIGYLVAMQNHDEFFESDDDTYPYDFFPNFPVEKEKITRLSSSTNFVNMFKYFSKDKKQVWARGFPLTLLTKKEKLKQQEERQKVYPIQQILINNDSDFDAIYRLTNNEKITFKKNLAFSLASYNYAPINSQATYWKKEAFLLMYLPCTVSPRLTDIYRGYIAQRLLWELGFSLLFVSPSVYQIRNPHDYQKDFRGEVPLYVDIENFIHSLNELSLKGNIDSKMIQIYENLIKNNFIIPQELPVLKSWIKEIGKII